VLSASAPEKQFMHTAHTSRPRRIIRAVRHQLVQRATGSPVRSLIGSPRAP
jgi:hypothetical protein